MPRIKRYSSPHSREVMVCDFRGRGITHDQETEILAILDDCSRQVVFRGLAEEVTFLTGLSNMAYLRRRIPSFKHHSVRCTPSGALSTPMTLEEFGAHMENFKGRKSNPQLIDLPLYQIAPELHSDMKRLKLDFTPAGIHCLHQFVTPTARPPMGPYVHFSPCGEVARTLGQAEPLDTVVLNLSNCPLEVLIIKHAAPEITQAIYQELVETPGSLQHGWPSPAVLDRTLLKCNSLPLEEAGDYREVKGLGVQCLVCLESGDLVNVPKGALFAARSPIAEEGNSGFVCFTTWHWMYQGTSAEACRAEAQVSRQVSSLNKKKGICTFTEITETAIHCALRTSLASLEAKRVWEETSKGRALKDKPFQFWIDETPDHANSHREREDGVMKESALLQGLHPLVSSFQDTQPEMKPQDFEAAFRQDMKEVMETTTRPMKRRLSVIVDAYEPPERAVVDPFSYEGYQCNMCFREIWNSYMHCVGCETLRGEDYNLCIDCSEKLKSQTQTKNRNDRSSDDQKSHEDGTNADVSADEAHGQVLTRSGDDGPQTPEGDSPHLRRWSDLSTSRVHRIPSISSRAYAESVMVAGVCSNAPSPVPNSIIAKSDEVGAKSGAKKRSLALLSAAASNLILAKMPHRACPKCRQCDICKCQCHAVFAPRFRFESPDIMAQTIARAREALRKRHIPPLVDTKG